MEQPAWVRCRDNYLSVLFYTLIVTLCRKGFTDLLLLTFYKSLLLDRDITTSLSAFTSIFLCYSMNPFIDIQPWLSFYCRLCKPRFCSLQEHLNVELQC